MEQVTHPANNPLKQYFRSFKIFLKIPSGVSYYPSTVVEYTDSGEIGVMPMTGKDELALKNPDALLNGEALIEIITSCVPAVKNPKALLTNDVDALITAIRYATYTDTVETILICPECNHENTFKIDLQSALDNITFLEPEYIVNLDSGLSVFVKPYSFPDLLKALHAQFDHVKISRSLEDKSITDAQRSLIFTKAFKDIAVTKYDLITNGIVKVVDESNGVNVTERQFIKEFLQNIDKKSIDSINNLIDEINQIGVRRNMTAKCEKCEHTWETEIDFNPVNFS